MSLKQLFDMPISTVKLDLRFLPGMPSDHRSAAIASAIIELAHALDIRVVAEKVEASAQADFFRHRCEAMQGFHFAHPLTDAAMGDWLQAHAGDSNAARVGQLAPAP